RGFIFGDGVYEVAPVYGRVPFRWTQHHARLVRNLGKLRIDDPMDAAGWRGLVDALVARHPWDDQFVYVQVTRGVAKRDHAFPKGVRPTVFAMSSPLPPIPAEQIELGVATITLPDERWLHCDIKSISLLGNVLARQAAVDAGAAECVMFRDGWLTEGSSSNVWVVRDGRVLAPPRDNLILEGIRYGLLEALCAAEGVPFEVRPIARDEVTSADELMLSSATKEVLPITRLDGRPVGAGVPGPVYRRLHAAYQRAKAASTAEAAGRAAR
ncbi:MAG: D-amino acid aminotransferase, partial [Burkholderiales bacterium]|nr:D-amino acid aminotransferase [Burkholderiales bacterium]